MVARDLGTKKVTSPTRGTEEPHIGSTQHNDPKPKVVQTGYSRGGTSNPPEGESGEVEIVVFDDNDTDVPEHDQGDLEGVES
ncbi:MAG TPA: hypothetical protein VIG24_01185 [Acidimicrobiia bacterium]